jgi:ABC-type phosphate transport system substrate-binding protein
VIERETLGLIWSGNITKWNDGRIQNRNLGITLPDEFITIGYEDSDVLTITEVVKRALESFSEEFRTALAAADRLFAQMPPALSSRALRAGDTTAQRISWLKVPRVHTHTHHRTRL